MLFVLSCSHEITAAHFGSHLQSVLTAYSKRRGHFEPIGLFCPCWMASRSCFDHLKIEQILRSRQNRGFAMMHKQGDGDAENVFCSSNSNPGGKEHSTALDAVSFT